MTDAHDPARDFDLKAAMNRLLDENGLTAEDALLAVLEGLMDNHADERRAARSEGRPMRVTILQGLEMLMAWESNKNLGLYDRQARDDQPDNTIYMSGVMFGGLATNQCVVGDILEECMRVLGAKPFREAA